jgi:acetate kinase
MEDYLLVLNAGSSTLKFSVYSRPDAGAWQLASRGLLDGIATESRFVARDRDGAVLSSQGLGNAVPDARAAFEYVTDWLQSRYKGRQVLGIGHRVVHGGMQFAAPVIVTPQVVRDLQALFPLAPLHQPHNVAVIAAAGERWPGVPQVACFDTSFHRDHAQVARLVPLPSEIRAAGVQRYGFHGLSYEYIVSVLPRIAPRIARGRVIVAHLGNGASLCAIDCGKSVDTTFGFTALDGLCMGTRPGALDPGVLLYLFQHLGLSAAQVETMLYRRSGLLAISGTSHDMRDLLGSSEPNSRLAVDYYLYRVAKEIGALAAVLGGLDGLVFTAGVGENSAEIRRRICAASAWLGVELDAASNERGGPCISTDESRVCAWVIPTNEELMIALHTRRVLALDD